MVKKYYSAVYAPKVADLYFQKHPLITLKPCFYGSKSMFLASLSILISKRMLTIPHFRAIQLTSVIFWFSRLKKYFVLSFIEEMFLMIIQNLKFFISHRVVHLFNDWQRHKLWIMLKQKFILLFFRIYKLDWIFKFRFSKCLYFIS